jgi:hypothetical protein
MALNVRDAVAGVELIPAAVEVFGDQAQLNDQNARQIDSGGLTSFFAA